MYSATCRCVTASETVQIPYWLHLKAPLTRKAVEAGARGVRGAPAVPPVVPALWAEREAALQETHCISAGGRLSNNSSVLTPPVLVRDVHANWNIK